MTRAFAVCVVSLLCASCGDSASNVPPEPGAIEVAITTVGTDMDGNGYRLALDSGAPQRTGTTQTLTFSGLAPGQHNLELRDIACNCHVAGDNPATVTVAPGATLSYPLMVECRAPAAPPAQISLATTSPPSTVAAPKVIAGLSGLGIGWKDTGTLLISRFQADHTRLVRTFEVVHPDLSADGLVSVRDITMAHENNDVFTAHWVGITRVAPAGMPRPNIYFGRFGATGQLGSTITTVRNGSSLGEAFNWGIAWNGAAHQLLYTDSESGRGNSYSLQIDQNGVPFNAPQVLPLGGTLSGIVPAASPAWSGSGFASSRILNFADPKDVSLLLLSANGAFISENVIANDVLSGIPAVSWCGDRFGVVWWSRQPDPNKTLTQIQGATYAANGDQRLAPTAITANMEVTQPVRALSLACREQGTGFALAYVDQASRIRLVELDLNMAQVRDVTTITPPNGVTGSTSVSLAVTPNEYALAWQAPISGSLNEQIAYARVCRP